MNISRRGLLPASLRPDAEAQEQIAWAEHLVMLYPLWLGDMPPLFKAFLEQTLRPAFAFRYGSRMMPDKLLTGRSAHVIVIMEMPGFFYESFYRAHSVKSFERSILKIWYFARRAYHRRCRGIR